MKYNKFIFVLLFLSITQLYGQKIDFPCQRVTVPDSVKKYLINAYGRDDCGAENMIYNLGVSNDIEFQNGVYGYRGMGPHFPQKIFIYYNNAVYVFNGSIESIPSALVEQNAIKYNFKKIQSDFYNCIDSLDITSEDSVHYASIINAVLQGKIMPSPPKIQIKKKSITPDILAGRWLVQVLKLTYPNRAKEWYRLEDPSYVSIENYRENDFDLIFLEGEPNAKSDYKPLNSDNGLKLKKAYWYNGKIFLVLRKKYSNGTIGEYLVSKCEHRTKIIQKF